MENRRFATLNLWNVFGSWEARRAEVLTWVRRARPDVLCLQEVWSDASRTQLDELVTAITSDGRRLVASSAAVEFDGGRLSNAILSVTEPTATTVLDLPGGSGSEPSRTALLAMFDDCVVMCTHLSPHEHQADVRQAQIDVIAAALTEVRAGAPTKSVVLAGDLNCAEDAPEMRVLRGADGTGLRAPAVVPPGSSLVTYSATNPHADPSGPIGAQIDHVLVADPVGEHWDWTIELMCHEPLTGILASDHFGLIANRGARACTVFQ